MNDKHYKKVVKFGIARRWGNSYKKYAVVVRNDLELKSAMDNIKKVNGKFFSIEDF